jgi:hypothetical protein
MEVVLGILSRLDLSDTTDVQSGMSISFRWIMISQRSSLFSERASS